MTTKITDNLWLSNSLSFQKTFFLFRPPTEEIKVEVTKKGNILINGNVSPTERMLVEVFLKQNGYLDE
jgi:hypothetical protein